VLLTVVLWAHIFAAIGWMGAAMIFGIVIGPSLAHMTPQSRTEFFAKVIPKFLRYVEAFSIMTVVFGLITVVVLANGDYSIFSLSTSLGVFITAGAVLAVVTVGLAIGVITPTARKMSVISQGLIQKPGPPPAELPGLASRLKNSAAIGLVLLIIITVLMVAGATGFPT
jgi:hypothetical protein